jgi:hypothetical protein
VEGNEIGLGVKFDHLILETCGGHVESTAIVDDGAWHHVAAVWSGSNMVTLYVDGLPQTDISTDPLPPINIISSGSLNIGQLVQFGDGFIGSIDEVQIFNRPLSESEIQAIFNAGSAGVCIPPPALSSVVSTKTHGIAGDFNINLPLNGSGIECRGTGHLPDGASADYELIFTFTKTLSSVASVSAVATSQGGPQTVPSNGAIGIDTHQYIVDLASVPNAQYVTVTLTGVLDTDGGSGDIIGPRVGFLRGDTTGDGSVNSADISQTKSKSGQIVGPTNFRNDVTTEGALNSADISLVKSRSGTALP